ATRPDYACVDALRRAIDRRAAADGQRAALIDLSDGLNSDAGRMARASGVTIDLDAAALDALADDLVALAAHVLRLEDCARTAGLVDATRPAERCAPTEDRTAADRARALARRWVLAGGEDHGFLAAVPNGVHPLGWTRIGRVRPIPTDAGTAGAPHVLIDGVPVDDAGFAAVDPDGGFRHFSGAGE